MEYDESRPYQAGDDIRTLDWRVTARTGRPHTKVFREERERPVYICCDFSPSMFFATQGVFKSVQAARAAALLAWKAQQSGDRVGGLVFSANTHHELPPERGKPGVIRLLKKLIEVGELPDPPPSMTHSGALAKAVARLKRMAKPGSLIFLLSDFRELDDACESDLARLARHNDLTLLFVNDPFEAALPSANAHGRVTDGDTDIEIVIGDTTTNTLYSLKRVSLHQVQNVKLEFMAPDEAGDYNLTLFCMSDSYLGCDQEYEVPLNVAVADSDDSDEE